MKRDSIESIYDGRATKAKPAKPAKTAKPAGKAKPAVTAELRKVTYRLPPDVLELLDREKGQRLVDGKRERADLSSIVADAVRAYVKGLAKRGSFDEVVDASVTGTRARASDFSSMKRPEKRPRKR